MIQYSFLYSIMVVYIQYKLRGQHERQVPTTEGIMQGSKIATVTCRFPSAFSKNPMLFSWVQLRKFTIMILLFPSFQKNSLYFPSGAGNIVLRSALSHCFRLDPKFATAAPFRASFLDTIRGTVIQPQVTEGLRLLSPRRLGWSHVN